ncbi:MAG: transcriptional regulator [Lysobacterales bacterium 69-70]|nr:RNA repair transcriptional activator RtcR [Xanthomonadaceae bacterium]ODU32879.1 MAG: transcriptional regulator [Xanthomonadaceae bacterium SCN 69-320]ODV21195.1 MAG: transcriptional regulator [Xanthomonadaceae bacterium SCN 69-25]OJZ00501.1 MAG: transcriptional regulator [Xanthomonadales bacterium 69-70]
MQNRPLVVIGFVGTVLDAADGPGRWEKWRPSVALGMYDDLLVSRLELLVDERRFNKLAGRLRADLAEVSPETQVRIHDFFLSDPWDFEQVFAALHEFARNYPFDTEREDYLVHISTGTHVAQICWFLLTEARFFPARLLQTSPPPKQRTGDPGKYAIIDLDLARYDRIAQRFARESEDTANFLKSGIATRSATFNRMIEQIERVAIRSKAPMLLLGPTGAGKSMLARNLFELKQRRHALKGRFVEVNCATLRGDGAGSALFGHVRGAFTGAQSERAGLLKSADGGLLFLDEIGELGLDEQAMLLRAIEDKRFPPLGGDREVSSDFQLIAGTNRDLSVAVLEGRFREDLFARLNLWTFYLPGLKERAEDIEPNLDFELERFARVHSERITFNREARERYLRFAMSIEATWPGNFRDLGASITRMATLATQGRITVEVVDEETARLRRLWGGARRGAGDDALLEALLGDELAGVDRFDRVQLAEVLRVCAAARSASDAGRSLFQASREKRSSSNDADRLRKYLKRFGLDFPQIQAAARRL